jgi:hypothetical protein
MNLETSSLFGAVISGTTQGNHSIQRILPSRCASLPPIGSSMMDEQNRDASASQLQ